MSNETMDQRVYKQILEMGNPFHSCRSERRWRNEASLIWSCFYSTCCAQSYPSRTIAFERFAHSLDWENYHY